MRKDSYSMKPYRARLSHPDSIVSPFLRAKSIEDIAVYWMPVRCFPIPEQQLLWINEFQGLLDAELAADALRPELFLQFKSLFPDLLDSFLKSAQDNQPFTGVGLHFSKGLPKPLTMSALETEIKKGGMINVNQWMMDYCHWFLTKRAQQQRELFFGRGGMCTLWIDASAGEKSSLEVPRIMKTHPLFRQANFEEKLAGIYSLKDPFLADLKKVFGEPFQNEPSYPGMLFVLPLFDSDSLLASTAEQRKVWFNIFRGYLIESVADEGILLAVSDPEFDMRLISILDKMNAAGHTYSVS